MKDKKLFVAGILLVLLGGTMLLANVARNKQDNYAENNNSPVGKAEDRFIDNDNILSNDNEEEDNKFPAENESEGSNYYRDKAASMSKEEADARGVEIMEESGTWGGTGTSELDYLIPKMSPEAVDQVVHIYLERHLFPEITTPEGAKQVAAVINSALAYMTENAREEALELINEYY